MRNRPPLGFFGAFSVEKSGEHKDKLDLKINALGPIVNIARLCALERGIPETGTLDRLAALRGAHPLLREHGEELGHAFEFLSLLRIQHQFEQLQRGGARQLHRPEPLSTSRSGSRTPSG